MRRAFCFALCLSTVFLCGCGGIYENYREVEQLSVIQTIGLDSIPGGVRLSLAGTDGNSLLTGTGETVEKALEQIRRLSFEEDLFIRRAEYILLGETAAKEHLTDFLSYICRSADMRIDTPVFVVKSGTAEELMRLAGDGEKGISAILQGTKQYISGRGDCLLSTVLDLSRRLLESGSGLICALELTKPSDETGDDRSTAAVSGCGIIKDGRLADYMDTYTAVGALFLMNKSGICTLSLPDLRGGTAVLEISGGRTEIKPICSSDAALTGLDIRTSVEASVTEIRGGGSLDSKAYLRHLTNRLEQDISDRINAVLRLSAENGADITDVYSLLFASDSTVHAISAEDLASLLPTLTSQVTVSALISHGSDMKGGGIR